MNNSFFSNQWPFSQYPRDPYYYYSPSPVLQTEPPHHHPEPVHQYPQPIQQNSARKPQSSAPKVVQIPVQFVNTETVQPARSKASRFESAVKIQKFFRGFLVRNSVKKIKSIENEVDEIEKRVSTSDFVELLKNNDKERLKVNEMLMSLLFELDSIRGFCSGVRDCRKAVIKKAIAVQERVDAIIAAKTDETDQNPDDIEEKMIELHQPDEQIEDSVHNEADNEEIEALKSEEPEESKMEEGDGDDLDMNAEEEVYDEIKNNGDDDGLEVEEGKGREEKGKEGNRELLEKMIEENGKIMSLMNQLFDRSEMQTQMLNSLTQRVEQLEKAFVCDRIRKKKIKKRHGAA